MSQRQYGEIPIVLTYTPESLKGKTAEECSEMANKDIDALCKWLRRTADSKGWEYTIHIAPSMRNCRNGESVNLHIHVLLKMTPASTGFRALQEYWTGHRESDDRRIGRKLGDNRGGLALKDKQQCVHVENFLRYMRAQSLTGRVRKQSNITTEEETPEVQGDLGSVNHVNRPDEADIRGRYELRSCLYRDHHEQRSTMNRSRLGASLSALFHSWVGKVRGGREAVIEFDSYQARDF